ncbi:hypothetical protein [Rhizobium rhizoryzae]|uniref:Uncharacterized protein n=1 Tax=Rhizobium rhizoryzae TaxID=451876 RepID=A0A7W6LM87_9HYPH|nr:hypothetical protein [Rhizobium rhizoryzae]MBB4145822.1 hypothetical protein [Rhizobium rhizoryzae]
MSFARIINAETRQPALIGMVAEVIEWDPEGRYPPDWIWVECPPDTRQFAEYDGTAFVNPPTPDTPPVIDPSTPFFPTLTRKQLRNGLLSIGVTSADVEAQIGTIADALEREAALIDWQDTQAYQRTNPLVNQIGVAMGLPEEQIDALWMWAAGQS